MLGFTISVHRQLNGGSSPAEFNSPQSPRLAVWQTGPGGLYWIDDLVKEKKAITLGGDGYPFRYTAMAKHLLPQVIEGPPDARPVWGYDPGDILGPAWEGKTARDEEALQSYPPDEWLLVEAWDES
jgi:hypothetical protein